MTSSRDRLEAALARIDDPKGEGARAIMTVYRDDARRTADAADARARDGKSLGPLDGRIVTIKDLFDVAGEVTCAGSKLIQSEEVVAKSDAPAVARLRAAGAVIAAKTTMVEFAFAAIGANPHFGTPGNPADRSRVPGGSTSGGAVAVADGMCEITIGSDTGGSTRIPAALCGIVGFKPSQQRIPLQGAFPLSKTLDSIGPMAMTVADCAAADAVMAGEATTLPSLLLKNTRIGIATGMPVEQLDDIVAPAWDAAVRKLTAAAKATEVALPHLDGMAAVNAKGGLVPPEGFSVHRARYERAGKDIDPMIAARFEKAAKIAPADYDDMLRQRNDLAGKMDAFLSSFDAIAMPTCPIVAPTIAEVSDPHTFARKNAMLLRNTSIGNFFNLTSISLPLPGTRLPVGLMLIARNDSDRKLFALATEIEKLLAA